jgi:uncharacterized membrane protein YuzA (DUF378 family)
MTAIDHRGSFSTKPVSTFKVLDWVALTLMIIGAINWGLVGAFGFNLVTALFGDMTAVTRIVYVLVGLAGLYGLSLATRLRRVA